MLVTFRPTDEYKNALAYIQRRYPGKTATSIIIDAVVYMSRKILVANSLQKQLDYEEMFKK